MSNPAHDKFGSPCGESRWFNGDPKVQETVMVPVQQRWMCPIEGCVGEMRFNGMTWPTSHLHEMQVYGCYPRREIPAGYLSSRRSTKRAMNDLLARRGKSEVNEIVASELAKHGKRVLYVTADAKAAKARLLKRNKGAWPSGLKVTQV